VPDFGPSNEHELDIARIVDRISIEGRLYSSAEPEVLALLGFMMYRMDREFLGRYIQWRVENPIPK
jgi:hypothetical protein